MRKAATSSRDSRRARIVLRLELSGFRPLTRDGIRLTTGETIRLDLRLEVGAADRRHYGDRRRAAASQRDLGARSGHRQPEDRRPAAERPELHHARRPGARAWRCRPGSSLPRINGGRPRTNEYLFDGISVLQPEPGQVAFFPNIDAIQEFKVESNSPPAEFGRFNGGVVNLTTKSGSNALSRHRLRVLPKRSAERAELLRLDESGQAAVPAQSVWRRRRRADSAGSHLLFRRLPGAAADDRPDRDLDRADAAPATGHLHRSHRRPRPGHLRSSDNGAIAAAGRRAASFPDNTIPLDGWTLSPRRCCSDIRCRRAQARPTTIDASPMNGRSGSVQRANRPSIRDQPRSRVRTADAISGSRSSR